nr:hypothetical protein [Anaerolineae bacterium]
MTPIYRVRLALIIVSLFTVLSVVPLASAQSDPLPLPMPGTDNLDVNPFILSERHGFSESDSRSVPPIYIYAFVEPVNVDGDSISVVEFGEPQQYTISLSAEPAGTVYMRYNNSYYGMVTEPNELVFSPENWNTPQIVTVYALMDYAQEQTPQEINFFGGVFGNVYTSEVVINNVHHRSNVTFLNQFKVKIIDNPVSPPDIPLVVTNLQDSITEEIPGSLRQVLHMANADANSNTVTFAPDLSGTIKLVADLPYSGETSIVGPGQHTLIIDGADKYNGIWGGASPTTYITVSNLTMINMRTAININAIMALTDVTVRNSGQGGGYTRAAVPVLSRHSANLSHVTLDSNRGWLSAGLVVGYYGLIEDSTFSNNVASGFMTVEGFAVAGHGALQVSRSVDVINSTFVGNVGGLAGAIGPQLPGTRSIYSYIGNSTFSNNASNYSGGAAAINANDHSFNIVFSTFSGHNTTTHPLLQALGAGTIRLEGSVIANNAASDAVECVGNIEGRANFSADPNCSPIYHKGTPLHVSPYLSDNGGPTLTHPLLQFSNVIDSDIPLTYSDGTYTLCEFYQTEYLPIVQDQRGISRPQFNYCDLGAFERNNLLTNPSFEVAGATDTEALGWTTRNLRPIDRRWCDTLTASAGGCAFRFRGPNLTAAPRRLIQTVPVDGTWGA